MKIKIIISIVLVVLIIPMAITIYAHNYHFDKRIVHTNNYFEYLSTLNPSFTKNEVSFTSDAGQTLYGAFYNQLENTSPKALVIWVHGMGVNHENYLAEIEYLTKAGYLVFSYDNTGVDSSTGESLKGLTQAPIDLHYALEYISDINLPIILVGHSWGGFAVASVAELELPVDIAGVISLAGFWKNINVITDIAKLYVGDIVYLLKPYLSFYEHTIFGDNSDINGIDGLAQIDAPVLIIHSKDDPVVTFSNNFEVYQNALSSDDRFTFKAYEDAGHKLTINKDSYNRIHDIMHHQMELEPESDKYNTLNDERLSLITDFNYDVMTDIIEFCDDITSQLDMFN